MKTCNTCKIEKDETEYRKGKSKNRCKDCQKVYDKKYNDSRKEKMKEYYLNNKEELKKKAREYYINNSELIKSNQKKYSSINKENRNLYLREKKKNDHLFNLTIKIRNLIYITIYNGGFSKKSKTTDILGCSYEEFKSYIQEQFVEGMTWENYGEWHLDHKTPISWAETEEQIYELNRYTNFQPLWASDNLSKGNKWAD